MTASARRLSDLPFLWLFLLAVLGCSSGRGVAACAPDAGHSTCAAGTECLWLRGGGYFCVARCGASGACPGGGLCAAGGASSCATCQDLIDVCE